MHKDIIEKHNILINLFLNIVLTNKSKLELYLKLIKKLKKISNIAVNESIINIIIVDISSIQPYRNLYQLHILSCSRY